MQDKFGGKAEAETDTWVGSMMQTSNAFGDLGEEMGRMNSGVLKTAVKFWDMNFVTEEERKNLKKPSEQAGTRAAKEGKEK